MDVDRETAGADALLPAAPEPGRRLQVAFTDGFADDTVVVRVDGAVASELDGLNTQMLLGMADERTLAMPDGPATLAVELPRRGLTATTTVDAGTAAVSVSVEDGIVVIRSHEELLGFA